MGSITVRRGSALLSALRSDRGARAFVWSVWLIMMLIAVAAIVKYGRNIPLNEDWWLVPPLTGNESNLTKWLLTQQSEHRIPLPRLILLALLKATHGDFRAGMLFNVMIFGVLAVFMIKVVRHLRGGRTSFADAFFPVALLHLGHYANFAWSWMITFNFPTVLACGVLLVLVSYPTLATPSTAVFAGISLVLLPLCGANGLLFVPILAPWLAYCGILNWRDTSTQRRRRWIGGFLIGSAVASLCLTVLYFVGYERPTWLPPQPGLVASVETAVRFLAMSFGPAVRMLWTPSIVATICIFVSTSIVVVLAALGGNGHERHRALGVLAFLGSMAIFALAMGWGRASAITEFYGEWPERYTVLALPALLTVFFVWVIYGPMKLGTAVQLVLFLVMVFLIPANTVQGLGWRDWFVEKDKALEQDLDLGISASILAERHRDLLCRVAEPSVVAGMIEMLHEAGMGPFARLREDPVRPENTTSTIATVQAQLLARSPASVADTELVTQEFRYDMPEAGKVYLVWGLNGWHAAPEELRPAGTQVKNEVMRTPMVQEGDTFVAQVSVPAGTTIDYCFLITQKRDSFDITWPLCEGNFRETATQDSVSVVRTDLTLVLVNHEIHYQMPRATEVHLLWGLNGWHVAPEELRPPGTTIRDNVMQTPMTPHNDTFVTKIWAPTGTTIFYGFLITESQGVFDVTHPVWDGDYQVTLSQSGITEVEAAVKLNQVWGDVAERALYFVVGAGVFFGTWVSLFFLFGILEARTLKGRTA